MKRMLCLLLALTAGLLAGCAREEAPGPFTAQNEIFTYDKVDIKKTQLVVSKTGNIEMQPFLDAFEARNPDVQVIGLDITGGNSEYLPMVDWVAHGYAPDVVVSAATFFTEKDTVEYFENLSANPILENYEADALKRTATQANVYWLPGPSDLNAIIYNKTLFARYGWAAPATFDEFVGLCVKIREDTNGEVEPWNPNAKYSDELQIALEAMTYAQVFGGADNRAWYNDFIEGKAAFTGHMEPYFDAVQKLADNGILREEHFSYSATTRGKEFKAGKIAMINAVLSDYDTEEFDFGYMPFPTTKGDVGYISDTYSCFVGIPKKERGEKERDALNRFVAFFSTPEGQEIFIGNSMKVSNVKNVPLNQSEDLAALKPAVEAGHMFALLLYKSELGARNFSVHQLAKDIAAGVKTSAECVAAVDAAPYIPSAGTENAPPETVATASEDFTVLETSFYIADAYREAAGADIALIANNAAYRGNLMRIFKGGLTPAFVQVLKPRSFENNATLVKAQMSGRQILDALNAPPDYDGLTSECVYAYSGLKCEIAPWNAPGQKYLSVTLSDGAKIDPDKRYSVAFWAGTVGEAYLTGAPEIIEGSFEDILTAKLRSDGTVAPAKDARVKLVWA